MAKANVTITITISPAAPPPLKIDTSDVPTTGTVGTAFDGEVNVSGGTPPDTLTTAAPTNPPAGATPGLPPGLAMDGEGNITGTPTTAGVFSFDVDAADSLG